MTIEDRKARKAKQSEKDAIDARRKKVLEDDLRDILAMPQGRRLIYSLLKRCGTFGTPFSESEQTTTTAYRCGIHSIGMGIYLQITALDIDIMGKLNESWHEMEVKTC